MNYKAIELSYWDIRGLNSTILHFISYTKVPFNFTQYALPKDMGLWQAKKASHMEGGYPLANLPMITDPNNGGKHLVESSAILQYLAQMYKPEAGPKMEEFADFLCVLGCVKDLTMAFVLPLFSTPDLPAYIDKVTEAVTKHAGKLNFYEATLKTNDWIFGNRVTFLDFIISDNTEKMLAMEKDFKKDLFTASQRVALTKHMERVNNLSGVKEYRLSDKFVSRPFHPTFTVWSGN